MTTKQEVIDLHKAEPLLTAPQIAERLGCCSAYVRATKRRYQLKIPKSESLRRSPQKLREDAAALIRRAEKLESGAA